MMSSSTEPRDHSACEYHTGQQLHDVTAGSVCGIMKLDAERWHRRYGRNAWLTRDSLKCCAARRLQFKGRQLATASGVGKHHQKTIYPLAGVLTIFRYLSPYSFL